MYYDTPAASRFVKPAAEAVIDLINQSNSLFFEYDELTLLNVLPVGDVSIPENINDFTLAAAALTSAKVQYVGKTGPRNESSFQYQRLYFPRWLAPKNYDALGEPLSYAEIVYFETTEVNRLADMKAFLLNVHKLDLDADEYLIDVGTVANADGSWDFSITPDATNPVWIGTLFLRGAPSDNIHFKIVNRFLDGLTYPEPIEEIILEELMDGFDAPDM